jgi:DNA-directed RNA polymerase subunit RPC12/RpoP
MTIACACQRCHGAIEFDDESAGQIVECPSCHEQTALLLPSKPKLFKSAQKPEYRMTFCLDCGKEISKKAILCPSCGAFHNIPFRLVWQATCAVLFTLFIISVIGAIIGGIFAAIVNAGRP